MVDKRVSEVVMLDNRINDISNKLKEMELCFHFVSDKIMEFMKDYESKLLLLEKLQKEREIITVSDKNVTTVMKGTEGNLLKGFSIFKNKSIEMFPVQRKVTDKRLISLYRSNKIDMNNSSLVKDRMVISYFSYGILDVYLSLLKQQDGVVNGYNRTSKTLDDCFSKNVVFRKL